MDEIKLIFDNTTLEEYSAYYFTQHPRAHKKPIGHPYHESINTWMIMKRPQMNALKQKWKDFITWFIGTQGLSNLRINECELSFIVYYPTSRRHDVDNSTPKFVIDGLCESGLIVDDDCKIIKKLTLECGYDKDRPRTEIMIRAYSYASDESKDIKEEENGKRKEDSDQRV